MSIMKYILIIFLSGIVSIGCSQKRKTDLEFLKLKGKVSEIKVERFSFEFQDSVLRL